MEDVLLQVSLDDSLLEVDNTDVAEDRSLLEGIASLLVVFGIVLRKEQNEWSHQFKFSNRPFKMQPGATG